MKSSLLGICFLLLISVSAQAQSFNSGSTGADGALDLSSSSLIVQLPPSGILNYTTVNIPPGRVLTFKRNLNNTPVIMLAQGNVVIGGTIFVSAGETIPCGATTCFDRRYPGPGGFFGGPAGQPGFGPGGGPAQDYPNGNGRWVGPLSLVPIIGGSGGGGTPTGNIGCGGGGAIVIASSTSITLTGTIAADGQQELARPQGSGGAIRLVANAINVTGALSAIGSSGNSGVVRLEAQTGSLSFSGSSNPPALLSTINPVVVPGATPSLAIVSIGGFPVPPNSGQRFDTADMLLPTQLSDPINVVVQASNIPVGTQVRISFGTSTPATSTPGTLTGTEASSSATATISGLNRGAVTYIFASATFNVPASLSKTTAAGPSSKDSEQVAKVRVEASPGSKPRYVFLRKDGTPIEIGKVPREIRLHFGM